ncbi:GbsR/MarR family transcriptional regulator [Saccharothrix obliqua]|uniref:GbsR/MarR family transcriptional regulator n=1 Tax=Saccharothrix obliqua TaxID=2861747 RepID=UPI001C5E4ADC|nr:MarR family transcriptional regulator [Saccharothrix obliqua]MBW4717278.1 MarR family transcriptional regulator [Saccharothrix obliqua]
MTAPDKRAAFVAALGDLLASWHLPRATGRVYGQLLLNADPVTLDDLGQDLKLSKGAVSTAVRELVSWGLARTIPQPGSRRLLVEAAGGFERLLAASHARTRTFVDTLRDGARLADADHARARLTEVADFFTAYLDAGDHMLHQRRGTRGAGPIEGNPVERP